MSTFILWDIDGTLIYNTPSAGALYIDAIEQVTGTRPTVPVPDPHGMTEGQLLAAILEVNSLDASRLGDVLYQLDVLSREQHERRHVRDACAGAAEALAAIAERGWTNALLTGNGPNRARYKLLAAGYDPEDFDWEHSYFGHQSPTRQHLTAGARTALAGHGAVIIGDTPNDGLAADTAGIPFIAVATGIYSADQLRSTSARVVVEDLATGLEDVVGEIAALATPGDIAATESALEEFGESPDVETRTEPEGEAK
jgi:phosphoglycolate phosphatase-like HAD superfamily hydrolase